MGRYGTSFAHWLPATDHLIAPHEKLTALEGGKRGVRASMGGTTPPSCFSPLIGVRSRGNEDRHRHDYGQWVFANLFGPENVGKEPTGIVFEHLKLP